MKTISFIPKCWRKGKASSSSKDASSSKQASISETPVHFPSDSGCSTSSSTLVEPILKIRDRSYSSEKPPDVRRDHFTQVHLPAHNLNSGGNLQQRSGSAKLDHSSLDANVPVLTPFDSPRESTPHRPLGRLASFETPRPALKPTASPTSSRKSGSLTPLKASSTEQYPSRSHVPIPRAGTLHSQKSMPELDCTWRGFLDDVEENDDSIRLDCPDIHYKGSHQRPIEFYDLETSRRSLLEMKGRPLKSGQRPSTSPAAQKIRSPPRSHSRSETTCAKIPSPTVHLPHTSENRGAIQPSEEMPGSSSHPTLPHHQRDISADFPLSLFPVPPSLIQAPTIKPRVVPHSSAAQLHLQAGDNTSFPKSTSPLSSLPPHPPLPSRKHPPKPLDLRSLTTTGELPPSPLDSPSLVTPITSRSPQSSHTHSIRTATSTSPISILKKKSSQSSTSRPYTSPPPTPPISPDYFGHPPSTCETSQPLERPSLRPAYSSSYLQGFTTPPPGAHRATMSESVNPPSRKAGGKTQTISIPEVSMPRKPLQKDAYMYPRPAPEPTSQVQWGYAV